MDVKRYWKRLRIILLVLFSGYFAFTMLMYSHQHHEKRVILAYNGKAEMPVGEITKETSVEQSFKAPDGTIEVSVLLATFARTNSGNVMITITGDDSGIIYFSRAYSASTFEDNQYVDFKLTRPINHEIDRMLRLKIISDSVSGAAITAWSSNNDEIDGELIISSQTMPGDLVLKAMGMQKLSYWSVKRGLQLFYLMMLSSLLAYVWPAVRTNIQLRNPKAKQIALQAGKTFRDPAAGWSAIVLTLWGGVFLVVTLRSVKDGGNTLQISEYVFYALVFLMTLFVSLNAKGNWRAVYLAILILTSIWIVRDTQYNMIDEGGHFDIINHVIECGEYPLIEENYEAVQAPIYYYLMAALLWLVPVQGRLIVGRFFGLVCAIVFCWLTRNTIALLRERRIILLDDGFVNIVELCFVANPCILIRMTRISNESLLLVLAASSIYLFARLIMDGYETHWVVILTTICAFAFLTKSTSVILFGEVVIVLVYHKRWKSLMVNSLLYIAMVVPWFASNYLSFGELTAMEGHKSFVLPIVNPDRLPIPIWSSLVERFDNYFFNVEAGIWFDYRRVDGVSSAVLQIVFFSSVAWLFAILLSFIKKKLKFSYEADEKARLLFLGFAALQLAALLIHIASSVTTLINTIPVNRYNFMLNGALCGSIFIAATRLRVSEAEQRYVGAIISAFYAFLVTAMCCGYIQIIWLS